MGNESDISIKWAKYGKRPLDNVCNIICLFERRTTKLTVLRCPGHMETLVGTMETVDGVVGTRLTCGKKATRSKMAVDRLLFPSVFCNA